MNKKIIVILGIIVVCVIVASTGVYVLNSNKNTSTETMMKNDSVNQSEKMMDSDESMMKSDSNSKYIEYSKDNFDNASGRVLFFYASWCPTCRPADETFSKNVDKIPEGITLIRVNYNDPETDEEEKALAKKYGITYQHTFVQIDENGNEIAKWNGGQVDELVSNIK